ncbi:MAG: hypothetical protein ABR587_02785 [Candidatus Binatia bacterium]
MGFSQSPAARLAPERPDLRVLYRAVDRDETARADFVALTREAGSWPPGVPTFAIDGRVLVNFDDTAPSHESLMALLDKSVAPALGFELPWIGPIDVSERSR